MVYEVEFTNKQFKVLHTALIYADSVTKCRTKAEDILKSLKVRNKRDVKIFIEESGI